MELEINNQIPLICEEGEEDFVSHVVFREDDGALELEEIYNSENQLVTHRVTNMGISLIMIEVLEFAQEELWQ